MTQEKKISGDKEEGEIQEEKEEKEEEGGKTLIKQL